MGSLPVRKIVLVHHPYLVDDSIYNTLSGKQYFIEWLRRRMFALTLKTNPELVVQSNYIKELLKKVWRYEQYISIIHNPLSKFFQNTRVERKLVEEKINLIYVSKAHPHKNHLFIINLAREIKKRKIQNVCIKVTISDKIQLGKQLLAVIEQEKLGGIINNIGEVFQAELPEHYMKATALIFPSKTETFGNPLIEAMALGLPVIVPDLPYAHAICERAGIYYRSGSVDDVLKIVSEMTNQQNYDEHYNKSLEIAAKYPFVDEWVEKYLKM